MCSATLNGNERSSSHYKVKIKKKKKQDNNGLA